VPARKIILVLPPRQQQEKGKQVLSVDAFYEGDEVEKKIHSILDTMGLKVYEGYRLLGIQQCTRGRLKGLILEDHVSPDQEVGQAEDLAAAEREREKRFPAPEAARAPMGTMEETSAPAPTACHRSSWPAGFASRRTKLTWTRTSSTRCTEMVWSTMAV
ncbi:unnamed protein product, partial [Effrenium voratum]